MVEEQVVWYLLSRKIEFVIWIQILYQVVCGSLYIPALRERHESVFYPTNYGWKLFGQIVFLAL